MSQTIQTLFHTRYPTIQYAAARGPAVDGRYGDLFRSLIDKGIVPLLDSFRATVSAINRNGNLSSQGQVAESYNAAVTTNDKILIAIGNVAKIIIKDRDTAMKNLPSSLPDWVASARQSWREQRVVGMTTSGISDYMQSTSKATDDQVSILVADQRFREIRGLLLGQSKAERIQIIKAAGEDTTADGLEILQAVVTAPGFVRQMLANYDVIQTAIQNWLQKNRPDQFVAVNTCNSALELLALIKTATQRIFAQASGGAIPDLDGEEAKAIELRKGYAPAATTTEVQEALDAVLQMDKIREAARGIQIISP